MQLCLCSSTTNQLTREDGVLRVFCVGTEGHVYMMRGPSGHERSSERSTVVYEPARHGTPAVTA